MKDFLDGDIYKFNLEKCGFPHDTSGNLTEETQYNGNAASIMQVSVPLTLGLVITYKTIVIYSWSQRKIAVCLNSAMHKALAWL